LIHALIILSVWLSFWLFEKLKFKIIFNDFLILLRQFQHIVKEDDDSQQVRKLLNISLRQFKLTLFLFLKLLLANLPVVLLLLVVFNFTTIKIHNLLNLYLLLDCIVAVLLYYLFIKYVRLKVQ
jgi:hypothetical protein